MPTLILIDTSLSMRENLIPQNKGPHETEGDSSSPSVSTLSLIKIGNVIPDLLDSIYRAHVHPSISSHPPSYENVLVYTFSRNERSRSSNSIFEYLIGTIKPADEAIVLSDPEKLKEIV